MSGQWKFELQRTINELEAMYKAILWEKLGKNRISKLKHCFFRP